MRGRTSWPAAMVVMTVLALAPVTGKAQTPEGGTAYGDWRLECEHPAGAVAPQCALVQHVTALDRPDVALSVVILKTADDEALVLRVVAPMGVLLPMGLGLRVDSEDIGTLAYVRCIAERIPASRENEVFGCIAEALIDNDLLAEFRAGIRATFIIFQTPEEGIGIPVSLIGFSAGFDALP